MATYVGIDQALNKIGVCVLLDGVSVSLHLIKTPRNLRGTERLTFLRNQLEAQLVSYRGNITHAALEAQSLGSLGDIDQLGQINGVVQIVLADLGIAHPLLVPPATLKKFVTGHGSASKARMMQATTKYWDVTIEQDDLCDAHGLARVAEEVHEQRSRVRHQIEATLSLTRPRKKRPRRKSTNDSTL